ncbi:U-box domain-containing protein 33-like isoform X1 [Primulina tabacum]|uniref:U-box domain-containing protein 33-like isoform X1 n=1 Tax=Primulina tabacum TaxID=48773 RepID=UPI003F59AE4E
MKSNLTIGGSGNSGVSDDGSRAHYDDRLENFSGGGVSEIEEDFSIDISSNRQMNNLVTIKEETEASLFSFDFHGDGDDSVYVAVWKQNEEASMDALTWAMKNTVITSSTVVFLIHVFPETKFIPSPLGKLSVSQVNPEQKENYMAQERGKRREFLQKFLNVCPTSQSQVKVDTILIESDMEAKAILDLIPILYIKKLVLGATKSNVRKIKSGRGNGVIDQILHNTPEFCDVKIICEGKEMAELMESSPLSPSPSPRSIDATAKPVQDQRKTENDLFGCGCFKVRE